MMLRKLLTRKKQDSPIVSHVVMSNHEESEWDSTYAALQQSAEVMPHNKEAEQLHHEKYKHLLKAETSISMLSRGDGRLRHSVFKLNEDSSQLLHRPADRTTWDSIMLSQIREIRAGQNTRTFESTGGRFRDMSDLSLSIIHGQALASVDLVFQTAADFETWSIGLRLAAAFYDNGDPIKLWIRLHWDNFQKQNESAVTLDELRSLMSLLNFKVRKGDPAIQAAFTEADENKDNLLDFGEFLTFCASLDKRPDILEIFKSIPKDDELHRFINPMEFYTFLTTVQKESVTIAEAESMIRRINGPQVPPHSAHLLTVDGFAEYLLGPTCDLLRPSEVPDMTHPLSSYWIATSHNTYLTGDQLKSNSSVDAYTRSLQLGCRCVELDSWDGPGNEPIITHGHTMTSKISFASVIHVIKKYAFHSSPYPLILSFENHCSIPQQVAMAKNLSEILGDDLCVWPSDYTERRLPSPESLKGKILIKAKTTTFVATANPDEDSDSDWSGDEGDRYPSDSRSISSRDSGDRLNSADSAAADAGPRRPTDSPSTSSVTPAGDAPITAVIHNRRRPSVSSPAASLAASLASMVGPSGVPSSFSEQAMDVPVTAASTDSLESSPSWFLVPKPAVDDSADAVSATSLPEPRQEEAEEPLPDSSADFSRRLADSSRDIAIRSITGIGMLARQATQSAFSTVSSHSEKLVPSPKITVAPELCALVFFAARRFKGFSEAFSTFAPNNMVSFSEAKMKKLGRKRGTALIEFNTRYLLRIYPGATRVDSSNLDPTKMWKYGCQLVALNYQTPDTGMQLNRARFRCDGGSGYILKPDYLRDPSFGFDPVSRNDIRRHISITIISAHFLPRSRGSRLGAVSDCYVEVDIFGTSSDEAAKKRSRTVYADGLNPLWNETFQFSFEYPELTFVRLTIMSSEDSTITNGDVPLGTFTFCLSDARQGYRRVPLEETLGEIIPQSSMLIKLELLDGQRTK